MKLEPGHIKVSDVRKLPTSWSDKEILLKAFAKEGQYDTTGMFGYGFMMLSMGKLMFIRPSEKYLLAQ